MTRAVAKPPIPKELMPTASSVTSLGGAALDLPPHEAYQKGVSYFGLRSFINNALNNRLYLFINVPFTTHLMAPLAVTAHNSSQHLCMSAV